MSEGVREASQTLQVALAPVVGMSRAVLDQFQEAAPGTVEVEFGVELSAEAGAVIAQASGACHLRMTLTWGCDDGPASGVVGGRVG